LETLKCSWQIYRTKSQNRWPQGGERKGYLKADARAKYGDVKAVIACIKGAGIENIGLITN